MKMLQKQVLTWMISIAIVLGMVPSIVVLVDGEVLNYSTDSVFVVMNSTYTAITDSWDVEDFGVNATDVTDLTAMDATATAALCGSENYRQILKIDLADNSQEGVENAIATLQQDSRIQSVSPNYFYEVLLIPNDPYYNGTMANMNTIFELIDADDAWDITTGSQSVTVGIIDTGIASHSDLGTNLTVGYDHYNENDITTDDITGHGTHVAGIVGAVGNNGMGGYRY